MLLSALTHLTLASIGIVLTLRYGVGINQSVSTLELQTQSYVGMHIDEFRKRSGVGAPINMANGRFQVSKRGFLSLFIPQHEIVANFDSENKLIDVFEVIYCFDEENGREIPIAGAAVP